MTRTPNPEKGKPFRIVADTPSNPFYDWKNPVQPVAWHPSYNDLPAVKHINEYIGHYQEGLISLGELHDHIVHQYHMSYTRMEQDARFPVPALLISVVRFPDGIGIFDTEMSNHQEYVFLPYQ